MNIFRHGDLLIKEIVKLPKELKKAQNNVLALGEVTGHSHRLNVNQICVFENKENQKFLDLKQTISLIHEEHNEIQIPKGNYIIIHEREYDPFSEEKIRQVMD